MGRRFYHKIYSSQWRPTAHEESPTYGNRFEVPLQLQVRFNSKKVIYGRSCVLYIEGVRNSAHRTKLNAKVELRSMALRTWC